MADNSFSVICAMLVLLCTFDGANSVCVAPKNYTTSEVYFEKVDKSAPLASDFDAGEEG